jgi:hypothetical protein
MDDPTSAPPPKLNIIIYAKEQCDASFRSIRFPILKRRGDGLVRIGRGRGPPADGNRNRSNILSTILLGLLLLVAWHQGPAHADAGPYMEGAGPIGPVPMGGIANATWEELEFYRLRDNIGRVVNPLNGDIYVFGGNTIPGLGVEGAFNDLWCFNRSSNGWTRLSGGDPDIMGRGEAALAFDAATGTIYMSGGRKGEMPYELRDLPGVGRRGALDRDGRHGREYLRRRARL